MQKLHLISGHATLLGVIGDPVGHSLSPAMHGYWYDKYAVDAAYVALPIKPQYFDVAFRQLPYLGFRGVNLTIPYKEQVIPLLDAMDAEAEAIGAVNTVVFDDDGKAHGYNTDGFGFRMAMAEAMPRWERSIRSAMVLGAGGATHAIVHELCKAGVAPVYISNRTEEKAAMVAERFGNNVRVVPWWEQEKLYSQVDLLVNATSLGMLHQLPLEVDIQTLKREALVMDAIYNPLETDLLRKARQQGNLTVGGLGMLIHQGRGAFQRWFGMDPKVDEALKVVLASRLQ